ncbi:hypothetical protein ElyMa_005305400 [Elysia marginata]|uniref:Uncharacterized protein n=1 Tax=Elysia marginata TaxID=1093978 RepID=A0AAV4JYN8_9GAST|nr:hypothetical protein ElyMa_005305400 [Elysia marginata]
MSTVTAAASVLSDYCGCSVFPTTLSGYIKVQHLQCQPYGRYGTFIVQGSAMADAPERVEKNFPFFFSINGLINVTPRKIQCRKSSTLHFQDFLAVLMEKLNASHTPQPPSYTAIIFRQDASRHFQTSGYTRPQCSQNVGSAAASCARTCASSILRAWLVILNTLAHGTVDEHGRHVGDEDHVEAHDEVARVKQEGRGLLQIEHHFVRVFHGSPRTSLAVSIVVYVLFSCAVSVTSFHPA